MDSRTRYTVVGAGLGALGVIAGAFAAHGLRSVVDPSALAAFETGARYHLYHAIALVAVGAGGGRLWRSGLASVACGAWTAGVVLFSGSLYLLALTGARWLGMVTPAGGLALILGWVLLAAAAVRAAKTDPAGDAN